MERNDLKLMVYESDLSYTDKNELLDIIESAYDSDIDYIYESTKDLLYITEKKTRSDYRIAKFKEKYGYDKQNKTILSDPNDPNSKRLKVNILDATKSRTYKGSRENAAKTGINFNGDITMTRKDFNYKHPKAHEFVVNHEIGHYKADRDPDTSRRKKEIIGTKTYQRAIIDSEKENSRGKKVNMIDDHSLSASEHDADRYAVTHTKNGLKVLKSMKNELIRQSNKAPSSEYIRDYLKAKKDADKALDDENKRFENLPLIDKINPKKIADHKEEIDLLKDEKIESDEAYALASKNRNRIARLSKNGDKYDANMRYNMQKELNSKKK